MSGHAHLGAVLAERQGREPHGRQRAGRHPQPGDRFHLPDLPAAPAGDRAGKRRASAHLPGAPREGPPRACPPRARPGGARQPGDAPAERAVRRPAAARRHRPGAGDRAGAAARRRAPRKPRRRHRRGDHRAVRAALPRRAHHLPGHPRADPRRSLPAGDPDQRRGHRQGRSGGRGGARGPDRAGARLGYVSLRVDLLEGGRIALRTLGVNRLRTALTLTAVGIGVATLLAILGIIQGLNGAFARQLASLGTATLNISRRPYVIQGDWWRYRNRKQLTIAQMQGLLQQSQLANAVVPEVNEESKDLTSGDQSVSGVDVVGTLADFQKIWGYEVPTGRFLTDADSDAERQVVVIGADVAEQLFPGRSALGGSVRIDSRPYRVIGVLAKKGQILGQSMDLV